MLGCVADAETSEIRIDPAELDDARWFSRDALRAAIAGRSAEMSVPPPFAIASLLIRAWVEREL